MATLSAAETIAILPAAIPAVVACVLPIAALDKDQATVKLVRGILFLVSIFALFGSFFLVTKLWATRLEPVYGVLQFDYLAQFAAIFVLIAGSMTVMQLWDHLHQEGWVKGEGLSLLLFSCSGMILFASTTNLILLFMALELMSIPLYALTGFVRQRSQALEGGMKYFLTGAVASAFMLMGIVLLYGVTGSFDLKAIPGILRLGSLDPLTLVAMAMLSLGFLFKVSAVPFHQWTPDAYEAAPHPIAAFMSVATKGVALIAMLRVFPMALTLHPELAQKWGSALAIVAVLTLVVGNLTALSQENVKRMLAYSSISHAGYMLLAFVAGTKEAYSGMLFYLLAYLVMNMGAFGLFSAMGLVGESTRYRDLRGLGWKRPGLAIPVALCMFSLAGLPPMGGFFGKYMIFKELVHTGHVGLAIVGVLASLVSVYFYLRVVVALFMEKPQEGAMDTDEIPDAPMAGATVLVCGVLSLVMGFAQTALVDNFVLRAIMESVR